VEDASPKQKVFRIGITSNVKYKGEQLSIISPNYNFQAQQGLLAKPYRAQTSSKKVLRYWQPMQQWQTARPRIIPKPPSIKQSTP
jgi:hypothetical protein